MPTSRFDDTLSQGTGAGAGPLALGDVGDREDITSIQVMIYQQLGASSAAAGGSADAGWAAGQRWNTATELAAGSDPFKTGPACAALAIVSRDGAGQPEVLFWSATLAIE